MFVCIFKAVASYFLGRFMDEKMEINETKMISFLTT